jgi:glutamate-1-semialdehyde 2,1-aminomutase
LLIFDEVKTSRCAAGGVQGLLGIAPDITTLGKYIGGGLPSGAFGGRADVMAQFDQGGTNPIKHAGTFNNNVCSMMAGYVALTKVFTPERAEKFQRECEAHRQLINAGLSARKVAMRLTGVGSLWSVHFSHRPIQTPKDIPLASKKLGQLFHMEMLLRGILVAARGDVFVSLAVTDAQIVKLRDAIFEFADGYGPLVARQLSLQS